MKISLVIPAYNEEAYIGACLRAAVLAGNGRFHEIIVIDNASTDRTGEVARTFSEVRVVREDEKGLTKARARGLAAASGELVAYIDADTRMTQGWIEQIEYAFRDPKTVSFSGPYHYYDASFSTRTFMRLLWWFSSRIVYPLSGTMLLGGNFVARRDALIAMGGFDTSIEFYGEDTDVARRLSKHGKVRWSHSFAMPTSSRRLDAEGLVRTNLVYGLNFVSELLWGVPYTKTHRDIRPTMKNGFVRSGFVRSVGATLLFGCAGLFGFSQTGFSPDVYPLVLFYSILLVNTFFSVRLFAEVVTHPTFLQQLLDLVLVALYLVLPFFFADLVSFVFTTLLLFLVATAKYVELLYHKEHPHLLKRKITVDLAGALGSAITLGLVVYGKADSALPFFVGGFALANFYLFFIRPLYRLDGTR